MLTTIAATALALTIFVLAALVITNQWSEFVSHIGA
jgi:uncharacterized oligopeptide transporter (OPT) family protein